MISFKEFLIEENKKPSNKVDFHIAGHFGSGKSSALKKANLGNRVFIIDLDELDEELEKIYGSKPSTASGLKSWHKKFKTLYLKKLNQGKKSSKPIVVVGHHWENGERFALVNAKEKVYIDIPKEKLFKQRKERDKKNPNLTDDYLEREYDQIQKELENENYQKLSFDEIVNKLRELK